MKLTSKKKQNKKMSKGFYTIIGLLFIVPPFLTWILLVLELFNIKIGDAIQVIFKYVPEILLFTVWVVFPVLALGLGLISYIKKQSKKLGALTFILAGLLITLAVITIFFKIN